MCALDELEVFVTVRQMDDDRVALIMDPGATYTLDTWLSGEDGEEAVLILKRQRHGNLAADGHPREKRPTANKLIQPGNGRPQRPL